MTEFDPRPVQPVASRSTYEAILDRLSSQEATWSRNVVKIRSALSVFG